MLMTPEEYAKTVMLALDGMESPYDFSENSNIEKLFEFIGDCFNRNISVDDTIVWVIDKFEFEKVAKPN